MAIVYPLALPTPSKIRTMMWRETDVQADVASPFTGQSQVIVFPGQWFSCTVTLGAMNRADAQVWDAWLASLRGHSGTFLLGHPLRSTPLGSASSAPGTPLVNGAGQSGGNLVVDGLPNSAPTYFKAGDFLQLGTGSSSRLHKVLQDVASDSSGNATISIWPNLRETPADNAAVVVTAAKGVFHRASPVTDWTAGPDANTQQRSFDAKERL